MSMNTQTYDFYGVPSRKNGNKFDPKSRINRCLQVGEKFKDDTV